jgi:hypothetical protein
MPVKLGSTSIEPGTSQGWSVGTRDMGLVAVFVANAVSPSFTDARWFLTTGGYPFYNQVGISTTWTQLSDDESILTYHVLVQNNSNSVVEYDLFGIELK